MDTPEKNSWDALLEEIGAEPTQDQGQPEPTPPAEPPTKIDLDRVPEPQPAASGWDSLLGDFGIDAPAPVASEPAVPDEPAAPAAAEPKARQPEAPQAVDHAKVDAKAEGSPDSKQDAFEAFGGGLVDTPDDKQEEAPAAVAPPAEVAPAPEPPPVEPPAAAPLPDFKTSLSLPDWFPFAGRRNKAAAEASEAAAKAPAAEPAPTPATEPVQTSDAAPSNVLTPESNNELGDVVSSSNGENEAVTGEGSGEPTEGYGKPTRRRRRRRGGRRRRSSGAAEPQARETPADATRAEEVDELEGSEALSDEPTVASAEAASSDDEAPRSRSRRRRDGDESKAIPSWPEAIGVVVDANIAMRSERKPATVGGSGRGGRGGRSRGRRRRKPAE